MSAILTLAVTANGLAVQGLSIPIGTSVLWTFLLQDPSTRAAIDLTVAGTGVIATLSPLDSRSAPITPATVSRAAVILGSPVNACTVAWAPSDTVPGGVSIPPALYMLDLWRSDSAGNRMQHLAGSYVRMTPAATLPATPVTPLPAQQPFGQYVIATATKTSAYTASPGDFVEADPTAAGFVVTLPLAASCIGQRVIVKNVSGSVNTITVTASGADLIDGLATYALAGARTSADYVSDGTKWMVLRHA